MLKNRCSLPSSVALACLVLVTGLPAVARAEDRALLVGVGRYSPGSGINNLGGIDKDVAMMRDIARRLGFRDTQIRTLMDDQATLGNIQRAMDEWLIQGVGPGERALFYFSGHGAFVPDLNGDEPDGRDEALIPHDARVARGLENVLVDDDLGARLGRIRSDRVLVLLDACHSGSATRDAFVVSKFVPNPDPRLAGSLRAAKDLPKGDSNALDASGARLNYVALNSSADTELSGATADGSLFTLGVFRAFQAAPDPQTLTLRRILEVATREVAQTAAGVDVHHPQLDGDVNRADMLLFASALLPAPVPGPAPVPRPVIPPPAPNASLWAQLERVANTAPRMVSIGGLRAQYAPGDFLQFSITMPADGYLNIVNLGEGLEQGTVLFPNGFASNNYFPAGTRVTFPSEGRYSLRVSLGASKAAERNLIVALVTARPINVHDLGLGQAAFRQIGPQAFRDVEVIGPEAHVDWAGKSEFVIQR